ncbi:hypothetical protein LOD99_1837 [Oopsacas minuta]|uniref:Uncharacterized protein n=1 Tax=Oopsacas minuta TaxID=111878 RepID=A0AAV7K376_9METZ|nr:hypothetical protein LOD99_1837 [Oopsacas minuta]
MISNIGGVITNLESSVNRSLVPIKCKSCGSTTAVLERISGQLKSIPVMLTIEIGHLPELPDIFASDIDKHFTISHNQRTLHYQLAGFSILSNRHFYSILYQNGQFCKYDGMREPIIQLWDCDTFIGSLNTVFYLLHSSD